MFPERHTPRNGRNRPAARHATFNSFPAIEPHGPLARNIRSRSLRAPYFPVAPIRHATRARARVSNAVGTSTLLFCLIRSRVVTAALRLPSSGGHLSCSNDVSLLRENVDRRRFLSSPSPPPPPPLRVHISSATGRRGTCIVAHPKRGSRTYLLSSSPRQVALSGFCRRRLAFRSYESYRRSFLS